MSVRLYMDVHVRSAVTHGLRLRGIDVLTAQEDGTQRLDDPALLDRASELERVLFSQDADLLSEAARRQQSGQPFYGVIYGHQQQITVGQTITDLAFIAEAAEPADVRNSVIFLPLR